MQLKPSEGGVPSGALSETFKLPVTVPSSSGVHQTLMLHVPSAGTLPQLLVSMKGGSGTASMLVVRVVGRLLVKTTVHVLLGSPT